MGYMFCWLKTFLANVHALFWMCIQPTKRHPFNLGMGCFNRALIVSVAERMPYKLASSPGIMTIEFIRLVGMCKARYPNFNFIHHDRLHPDDPPDIDHTVPSLQGCWTLSPLVNSASDPAATDYYSR